jgi:hypothetical protein
LQNSQNDKALADVELMLRLADAIRTEPFLLSQLVRIAVVQIAVQPIYEGLANHEWSNSQMTELDSKLSGLDFLTDYKFSLRGDMIIEQDGSIDFLHHHPGIIWEMRSFGEGPALVSDQTRAERVAGSLVPAGWFYQNEIHDDRAMEEFYLPVVDTNQQILSPTSVDHAEAVIETESHPCHVGPYNILEGSMSGSIVDAMLVAYGQNAANLTRIAIALERYRLAHGEYPDSLSPLAPQFIVRLPHDIINGRPLHYRQTADGRFLLYSLGWKGTDDGGRVLVYTNSTGSIQANRKQGDWVWRYPER